MLKHSVLIDRRAVRSFAARVIEQYSVKCGGSDAEARSLSGGNLQKFIVGREVLLGPKVLIVRSRRGASTSAPPRSSGRR